MIKHTKKSSDKNFIEKKRHRETTRVQPIRLMDFVNEFNPNACMTFQIQRIETNIYVFVRVEWKPKNAL